MAEDNALSRAVGQEIYAERTRLGLNTATLGAQVTPPIHGRTLATYEQATRKVSLDKLEQICAAMGIDMIDLIRRARARVITKRGTPR